MGQRSARIPRVFVENFTTPRTALSKDELHHLKRVLRLSDGDPVRAFDAAGNATDAILAGGFIEHAQPVLQQRDVDLCVASAVPKGDRVEWLVEKLAELGVSRWQPLTTEHSTVDPRSGKLAKLRRRAIEAAKQADTPGVMNIGEPMALDAFLSSAHGTLHVLSTQQAAPPAPLADVPNTLLIGPEGGWSDGELATLAERGASAVTLGPTVLRIETAAIVGAGVFAALLRR